MTCTRPHPPKGTPIRLLAAGSATKDMIIRGYCVGVISESTPYSLRFTLNNRAKSINLDCELMGPGGCSQIEVRR